MKSIEVNFDIWPKVVLSESVIEVNIVPRQKHTVFRSDVRYEATHRPMEDFGSRSSFRELMQPELRVENGSLIFAAKFEGEQEHSFVVEEVSGDERNRIGDFRIYSVAEDLFNRRPYKGDLHIHSNRSDGREPPGYVAASCRKTGFDFMAVTDHGQYAPSIEAQDAFRDAEIDLQIFPGEEVHPPENPIHIINFGGAESINLMFNESSYREEVAAIRKNLGDLPDELDPYYYASSLWCFDKIREIGGLGIFCHPYWVSQSRYHIPGSLTSKIFEEQPYDAYELIGGYHLNEVESNMLQVLRYQEEIGKGSEIPIVGVSDAHGCDRGELFGWYYTITFSLSKNLPDLISSIKDLYSVAAEHLPATSAKGYGPFRMAKFALYLIREVFPHHDELCREEGELMIRHLNGDAESRVKLAELAGREERYMDRCYAGAP